MRIQYLGHASFRLISDGFGHTVVTDPYNGIMIGEEMPYVSADVVTCSHAHDDHNCVSAVKGDFSVVDSEGKGNFDDIYLDSFYCFHDDCQGKKRGKSLVFVFTIDGVKIAHMGDVGEINQEVVDKLKGVDILLLPVGGFYTIDSLQAKWYVDQIRPKIAIPMHYKTENCNLNIAPCEDFYDLFDFSQVEFVGDTVYVYAFDEEDEKEPTKIYVMQKFAG